MQPRKYTKMHSFGFLANSTSFFVSVLVFLIVGCKNKQQIERTTPATILTPKYSSGPTNLIRKIGGTDHIIVAYRFPEDMLQYNNFTITLTGSEMNQALLAIASLEGPPPHAPYSASVCDWQLQFYRGSVRLGEADFQDYIIRVGPIEYRDESGVINSLYGRVQGESNRRRHEGRE